MISMILSTIVILTTNSNVILLNSKDVKYVPTSVLDLDRMEQRGKIMREGRKNIDLEDSNKLDKSEENKLVNTSLIVSITKIFVPKE